MLTLPRKSTYEVRVAVSVILDGDPLNEGYGHRFGPMELVSCSGWGRLWHLEFTGEVRAWKRWAVASRVMQWLNEFIEDGTEVVFYIEENTWKK